SWPAAHDIADLIEAGWEGQHIFDFIEKNVQGICEFEVIARERFPEAAEQQKKTTNPNSPQAGIYRETCHGLVRVEVKRTQDQGYDIEIPLTNFTARIVADIARDDGAE